MMRYEVVAGGGTAISSQSYHHGFQQIDLDAFSRSRVFLHDALNIPFHWHREMEILLVLNGSARIVVEGQSCKLCEGDLMIINANETHNSVSLSADTIICGIHIDVAHYERLGLPGFGDRAFRCRSFLHGKHFEKISRPIKALVARMMLSDTQHSDDAVARGAMVAALCCFIHRFIPSEHVDRHHGEQRRSSRDRILRIIERVAHSERTPSLSEFAEAEAVSLSHLSRVFREHTGITFRDYAQAAKIEIVAEDLLTTDGSISNIMNARGVGNPSLFFHRFRKRFGCSPGQFRQHAQSLDGFLPDRKQTVQAKLLDYVSHLAAASELIFGLIDARARYVSVNAFHQTLSVRRK